MLLLTLTLAVFPRTTKCCSSWEQTDNTLKPVLATRLKLFIFVVTRQKIMQEMYSKALRFTCIPRRESEKSELFQFRWPNILIFHYYSSFQSTQEFFNRATSPIAAQLLHVLEFVKFTFFCCYRWIWKFRIPNKRLNCVIQRATRKNSQQRISIKWRNCKQCDSSTGCMNNLC